MRNFLIGCLVCLGTIQSLNAQESDSIHNLVSWIRANELNGQTSINSFSELIDNLKANSNNPIINFHNSAVYESDTAEVLKKADLSGRSGISLFMVIKPADTTEHALFSINGSEARRSLLTTHKVLGPDSTVDVHNSADTSAIMITLIQNWAESQPESDSAYLSFFDGQSLAEDLINYKGAVAEIMYFNTYLPYLEKKKIETYLAIKYGLTMKEGNYVSSEDEVLWNQEELNTYSNRIVALGRDDQYSLNQKQAKAVRDHQGFLTASIGQLESRNFHNKSVIPNSTFWLMGDNGEELLLDTASGNGNPIQLIKRKWIIDPSGEQSNHTDITFQFDLNKLPVSDQGYWLAIDRSGEGEFNTDRMEYIEADSITKDNKAVFTLRWDTDNNGRDGFTLAQKTGFTLLIADQIDPDCQNAKGGQLSMRVLGGEAPYEFNLYDVSTGENLNWTDQDNITFQNRIKAGQYRVSVEDAAEQNDERQLIFDQPNNIIVEAGEDQSILEQPVISLEATVNAPDSVSLEYHWENSFGKSFEGNPVEVTESGIYTVFVIDEEGCQFTDELTITGAKEQRFMVYPSPVEPGSPVNMSVSLEETGDIIMRIYDVNGLKVYEEKGTNNSEFHFQSILNQSGVYIVEFEGPKGKQATKYIIN